MKIKRFILLAVPLLLLGLASAPAVGAGAQRAVRTDTPREALETARLFLKQAKYAKAVVYYDVILTRFKESKAEAAWALYEKSYCLYKMRKYALALQGFRSIRVLYPDEMGPLTLGEKMIAKIELKHGKAVP
jgi:outer membrane protein assembly factor BamD (BamD/ComL family)